MKITLTAIKADIGSIGGHTKPSKEVLEGIEDFVKEKVKGLEKIVDFYIGHTGDDVHILLSHTYGTNSEEVHKLVWEALEKGAEIAKEQGLYGAGQDLFTDCFSGNIKGAGPGIAEMEFEERKAEAFILFTADKTSPGAFNFPFYEVFANPMKNTGLILSKSLFEGFVFRIQDVSTPKERWIELKIPEEYLHIAALLKNVNKYVIKSISLRNGEIIADFSTTKLQHIAGRYVGKDDPVAIIRTQKPFAATEEVCSVFEKAHYVPGNTRGSHYMPLMPVKINSLATTNYCIPIVSAVCFSMKNGRFTSYTDAFATDDWNFVRQKAYEKSRLMREQGFLEPATLSLDLVEYKDAQDILERLEERFVEV